MLATPEYDPPLASARFSPDGKYRYELSRIWDPSKPLMAGVLLNPSTASAEDSDPTMTRFMNFARRDGFGGGLMVNMFAIVLTDSTMLGELKGYVDIVGPENDDVLASLRSRRNVGMVVCAWGARRLAAQRAPHVLAMLVHARRGRAALLRRDEGRMPEASALPLELDEDRSVGGVMKRVRTRVFSSLRIPAMFILDYAQLSHASVALLFMCVSRAADDYDSLAPYGASVPSVVYPIVHARALRLSKTLLARALTELSSKCGSSPPIMHRVTDTEYELTEPTLWFVKKMPPRKKLPRKAVFERDAYRCAYCSASVTMQTGHVDHVVPHSRGGSDELSNLTTACGPCNSRKHARTPSEWLQ